MVDLVSPEATTPDRLAACQSFFAPEAMPWDRAPPALPEIVLERGDFLFREGDAKTQFYRLESGILCVTAQRPSGPPQVVEMVFPGGLLGLGFLDRHIHSAMAVVPCRVSLLPPDAINDLCRHSAEARDRQALATEREFAARRRQLVGSTADSPIQQVAAFLAAMFHVNKREGRNPHVISEFLKSGDVAGLLQLDVETLAVALADLQARGLISRDPNGGLVLLDAAAIENLSSATE